MNSEATGAIRLIIHRTHSKSTLEDIADYNRNTLCKLPDGLRITGISETNTTRGAAKQSGSDESDVNKEAGPCQSRTEKIGACKLR